MTIPVFNPVFKISVQSKTGLFWRFLSSVFGHPNFQLSNFRNNPVFKNFRVLKTGLKTGVKTGVDRIILSSLRTKILKTGLFWKFLSSIFGHPIFQDRNAQNNPVFSSIMEIEDRIILP